MQYKNKFLPRTVLRSFLHKLERNLMQSLELASIVSQKDTHLLANIVYPALPKSLLLLFKPGYGSKLGSNEFPNQNLRQIGQWENLLIQI